MTEQAEKVIQFPDSPSAFAWAEEILERYPVESQISKLVRVPGIGEFTKDELRDQALTISKIVSRCEPPHARLVFQFVYGRPDNVLVQDLVDALVRHVYAAVPRAKGRQPHRLTALVASVLAGFRRYKQFNIEQSKASIAHNVGIKRQLFSEGGWPELVGAARTALNDWLRISEDALNSEMKDIGFVA